jgi:cell division protein FtsL
MRMSAAAAAVYMPRPGAGGADDAPFDHSNTRRGRSEPAGEVSEVARMAKRRLALRGRSLVALGLLGFVLIATGVIWRRAAGISQAADLRALEQQVVQLEAQQARLENEIREASSRSTLAPIAERRLGMRVPSDTQVVILPRSPRSGT